MAIPPRPSRRRLALAGALLLVAGSGAAAGCPQGADAIARELVARFTGGTLSVAAAGELLGAPHTARREGAYWLLQSPTCPLRIVLPALATGAPLPEAELHLRLESGLQLRQLEAWLGAGEPLLSGKTSSVLFRVPGATGGSVLAFARLHSNGAQPASPVLTLLLRRVGTT